MYYNKNSKVDIRNSFIEKELQADIEPYPFKLTKRFISWLFRHYYVWEFCLNFYDEDREWDARIKWNNWQDVFFEGAWGQSQKTVDRIAKDGMNQFRKAGHLNGRCWLGMISPENGDNAYYLFMKTSVSNENLLHIYLYGRDIHEADYHFIMKKKGGKTRSQLVSEWMKEQDKNIE